ncbi:MAG TPA: hypothetical protein PKI32_03305, partial [Opitutales bacterium]|nr:hypothetical protein [Opitutales bacterium]
TAKRIITSIPALFRELFRRKTDNAAADEGDAEAESPEPERAAEQTPVQGDNSRRDNSRQQPPSQAQNQHSRGRRGGRRHTRRGGDGNNHDRGGERDWRENSY